MSEADRLWLRRAAELKRDPPAPSGVLQDGALCWLTRPGEAAAAVRLLQVRGVAGLDKIRSVAVRSTCAL